jgi:hypothetical protein
MGDGQKVVGGPSKLLKQLDFLALDIVGNYGGFLLVGTSIFPYLILLLLPRVFGQNLCSRT